MKLKLDENIGRKAHQVLVDLGYDVHTVHDEGLRGAADKGVLSAAFSEGRVLVTQDRDFIELVRMIAPHCGIFWVRLRAENQKHLPAYLHSWFADAATASQWAGRFVIARESVIRVR